ncbi:hypothetical protein [Rhodopseudomonas sp.]|uniref:hypothetical protein n=1 Tax=Rhodopseudomonas sp. TaxID=1078 RepID=UPI0039E6C103
MSFGRGAFGRAAFGRSAVGSSIFVTPTAGVVSVESGALHVAVSVAPSPEIIASVAGGVQAILWSSAAGRIAHHGESVRADIVLAPGRASLAVVRGTVQALLWSSAFGRIAYQAGVVLPSVVTTTAAAHIAGVSGALHATLGVATVAGRIVVKSGSGIAAGIPGNFTAAFISVVGGNLHAIITGVPGDRYRDLRSRAFGRAAFGRLTETRRTFMPSHIVVTKPGAVASSVTLHPASSSIAWRAASMRSGIAVNPASASLAIVAGRFPVRARAAAFLFD